MTANAKSRDLVSAEKNKKPELPKDEKRSEDRRSRKTRHALREALAQELRLHSKDKLTVSALTERADLSRRTFYAHYKDVPSFVESCTSELLDELAQVLDTVGETTLDELYEALGKGEGYPGALAVFEFMKENAAIMQAILGEHGTPSFQAQLKELIINHFSERFMQGIDPRALGPLFDYYVTYSVSAQLGVVERWLKKGLKESPAEMARIATAIMFARPGDLYGRSFDDQPLNLITIVEQLKGELDVA